MAKKSDATKKPPAADESPDSGSVLVSAAKAMGAAAGKVAAITHVATPEKTSVKHAVRGKYAPKNKSRLPRKQKKALQRASAAKK